MENAKSIVAEVFDIIKMAIEEIMAIVKMIQEATADAE